jgi:hypothetical protein
LTFSNLKTAKIHQNSNSFQIFSQFSQVSEGHRQRHERPGAGQWELQSAVPPGRGPTAAGRRGGGEGGSVEGAGGWIPSGYVKIAIEYGHL